MTNLANRPPLGIKEPRPGPDPERLAKVRELPCVICEEWDMPQLSHTAAHHCIHERHGTRKTPDSMAIPLCEGHHQGLRDTSKVALHREPEEWQRLYGLDTDWLEWTSERLDQ